MLGYLWFLGLLSGMAISVFSKPLAVLFGILVFSVQVWSSYPIAVSKESGR